MREARFRPDFINPPPERPRAGFAAELARVRATPLETVERDIGWAYEGHPPPAAPVAGAGRGLDALADLMADYWRRAIEPVLARDPRPFSRPTSPTAPGRLAAGGPLAAFADLHEEASWQDGALRVDRAYEFEVELGGRGLLLVPVAFAWPQLSAMIDPPWQPAVVYAPHGVATLWAPQERPADALADLLGRRRAGILAGLAEPATTQELSRRLAASPAGVSEHLAVLRRAGLVSSRREGRGVRYARTPAGDELIAAAG